MRRMILGSLLASAAVFTAASPAPALSRDEVIALVKAGVGDPVIVGLLKADGSRFQLSAQDVIELKKAGVSDAVLAAMVATGGAPAAAPAPAPAAPPAHHEAPAPIADVPDAMGTLVLSNQDDRAYSVMIDEPGRRIFYYYGSANDRIVLGKNETRTLSVAPGLYRVRWVGSPDAYDAPVRADQSTKLVTTAVRLANVDAVQIAVFAGDREVIAGTLRTFREAPPVVVQAPAPAPVVIAAPAPAPTNVYVYETRPYVPSYTYTACAPATTYVYRSSYCEPTYTRTYTRYSDCSPSWSRYECRDDRLRIGTGTILGGGIGAVVNRHHRGGSARGAAIGAGIGFLLDNARGRSCW